MFGNAKIKYKKALALQKLERDSDGVYVELKYHFVWNIINRRPVFHLTDYSETIGWKKIESWKCLSLKLG